MGHSSNGKARLRVLFFIAYPQRMAGANRSLFHLVANLPDGVEPLVVVSAEGPVAQAYRDAGIECEVLPAAGALGTYGKQFERTSALQRLWIAGRDVLPYTLRLARLIRRHGISLVHTNDPRATLMAAPAARLAGRPVVSHLRGEFPFGEGIRRVYERLAGRIVTVSEGARMSLTPLGRRKASTVYNGIGDVPQGPGVPWLESLRADGVAVACCFASVVPFKGYHHLVRAAARLNERGWRGKVAFVCVGDLVEEYAGYSAWLRELIASLGVDNVTFTGWHHDPFAFYRSADFTLLPSVSRERLAYDGREHDVRGNEGLPRTHLEAMRFGLPVVGTRIAGVPEQVEDGRTGLLADPGDDAGLADAVEALLRDPAERRRMGERARERVERVFSTHAYVGGVMAVYDEVLGRKRP